MSIYLFTRFIRFFVLNIVVTTQTIRKGSDPNQPIRAWAQSMGRRDDDAGHIIANVLGGTGRQRYNIFPQKKNINRGVWRMIESKIRRTVEETQKPAEMIVQLYYPSSKSTRPNHLKYRVNVDNKCLTESVNNP